MTQPSSDACFGGLECEVRCEQAVLVIQYKYNRAIGGNWSIDGE